MCDQQRLRSACAYAQSYQSLWLSLEYSMNIKLLTEHHLDFLNLTGGCTGSYESTLVKIPHCWKSRDTAQMVWFVSMCLLLPDYRAYCAFVTNTNGKKYNSCTYHIWLISEKDGELMKIVSSKWTQALIWPRPQC